MRTEEARVVLRPRGGLEALDLGVAMARAWWRPLAASWLALVVPFAGVLIAVLNEHPFWALLLLWWLRPLFGRVPLHVLSRALFGEPTSLAETARALPGLLRGGVWSSLVTQRLSPARTFLLPVTVLEGLRGAERRARCAVLARSDLGSAMGLMTVGAHMNACIVLGLLAAAAILVPEQVDWGLESLFAPFDDGASWLLLPVLYFAGTSAVEPLLVAGGFALYLNRRVDLEGWDLDLAFRRLAQRAGALASAAAALGLALVPVPAYANAECIAGDPGSASSCVAHVLAEPAFVATREVEWWTLRDDLFDADASPPDLGWLGELIATLGEVLLWAAVAVGAIALCVGLAGIRRPAAREPPRSSVPVSLFGLDLAPERLPEDVVGAARAAWARGAHSEALSLLYRGALVALVTRGGVAIPRSATELECVRLARASQCSAQAPDLQKLTDAWLRARYAGAPPADDAFESLCSAFARAFGPSLAGVTS